MLNSVEELEVTPETLKTLTASLDMITSGRSEGYQAHKARGNDHTALVFFYNSFFENVYNRLPITRTMFQGNIAKQGQMFAALLKFLVKSIGHEPEFTITLQYLAMLHNALGVTTQQYSLMGIILVDTVATCLGTAFTDDIRSAWITTYSSMMTVMIPVVEAGTRITDQWLTKHSHNLLPEYRPDHDEGSRGRTRNPSRSASKEGDRKSKNRSKSEGKSEGESPKSGSRRPSGTGTTSKTRSRLNMEGARGVVPRSGITGSQAPTDDGISPDPSVLRSEESVDEPSYVESRSRSDIHGRVEKDDEEKAETM
jgi:hemoglobin-like flavoprotein